MNKISCMPDDTVIFYCGVFDKLHRKVERWSSLSRSVSCVRPRASWHGCGSKDIIGASRWSDERRHSPGNLDWHGGEQHEMGNDSERAFRSRGFTMADQAVHRPKG